MNEEAKQEQLLSQEMTLPIEWHIPENIQSRYATNMLVQAGSSEFFLSFFETQPPLIMGTPEEQQAYLEQLKSIRAECVGKIIVSADLLPKIIEALQTNLEKFRATRAAVEGEIK